MGQTPRYGFPFPDPEDAPDIAADVRALARAVEAQVERVDTTPTMQRLTSSGTWVKPDGLKAARVRVAGDGGAGGGVPTTTSGEGSEGAGGGAGGYAEDIIPADQLGATETVVVGSGGIGVSGGNGNAGTGSSFGSLVAADGGGGGSTMSATTADGQSTFGRGGDGTAGTILISGNPGFEGVVRNGGRRASFQNMGGAAVLGPGGPVVHGFATAGESPTSGYGGGGSGARNDGGDQPARSGGRGAGGVVIIEHYF